MRIICLGVWLLASATTSGLAQISSDSIIIDYLKSTYGISFSYNNDILLLQTGQEKFDELFQAVRSAKKSIHLEYFNFRNDSISEELFFILKQKAAEGVEVRALFDSFGNSSNNRPLKKRHLDSLQRAGIDIREFDPIRFPYLNHALHRDHRKIVIIDGHIAFTGGMNVADYYIKGKKEFGEWHDLHCRIEGDAVDELQKIFIRMWNKQTHQNLSGTQYYSGGVKETQTGKDSLSHSSPLCRNQMAGVVDRVPLQTDKIIHDTYIKAFETAQKSIQIINPYATMCRHLRKALKKAVKRGVEVELMISARSDIPITPRIVEHNAHRLMKAGVKVYVYEGGFHHTKIMMVDSLYAFIGSANLNSRSLSFDYECNLLIAARCTTESLQQLFSRDKNSRCWLLTPETWKKKFSKGRRRAAWFWQFLSPFV